MANTSVRVEIELDPKNSDILQLDSKRNISATNINPLSSLDFLTPLLIEQNLPQFITLEHNINILDGSLIEYNWDLPKYGYISDRLSDNDCKCDNKITIDMVDNEGFPLNLYGLLLYFGSDIYIGDISLSYICDQGLIADIFKPHNKEYRAILEGTNVKKIEINFTNTQFPRMFTRLGYITDNLSYELNERDIISCHITDSFSPISQVLPINTAEIVVYSHYDDFDLINNMGIITMLRKNSKCTIIGKYNNQNIPIGVYYIDKVEGQGKDSIKFSVKSYIGIFDDYVYQPEYVYTNTGNNLINKVLSSNANIQAISQIPIDFNKTYEEIIIPSGTARESLQAILFMLNGAMTDREGIIEFFKPQYNITRLITKDMIIDAPKLNNDNDINTISVDIYDYSHQLYTPDSDLSYTKIYEGNIPEGGIRLVFDKPAHIFRYKIKNSSGEEISDYDNPVFPYATGTLSSVDGWSYRAFTFQTLYYTFNPQSTSSINVRNVSFIIEMNFLIERNNTVTYNLNNNDVPRLLNIQNPKIFNQSNVSDFSNGLLKYYGNNPLKVDTKYIWDGQSRVGDTVYIYTEYKNYIRSTIVKQSIDLGNGFIASITAVGKEINIYEDEYMSDGNDNLGNSGQYDIIMQDNIQF